MNTPTNNNEETRVQCSKEWPKQSAEDKHPPKGLVEPTWAPKYVASNSVAIVMVMAADLPNDGFTLDHTGDECYEADPLKPRSSEYCGTDCKDQYPSTPGPATCAQIKHMTPQGLQGNSDVDSPITQVSRTNDKRVRRSPRLAKKKQAALSNSPEKRGQKRKISAGHESQHSQPSKRRRVALGYYNVRDKILQDENNVDSFRFVKHVQALAGTPYGRSTFHHPETKLLPPSEKPTLVLDLDETLVHSNVEVLPNYDYRFTVAFGGHNYCVYVRKRPGVEEFLRKASRWYNIVVFTASQSIYANRVLDLLACDMGEDVVSHRLFRQDCTRVEGNYLKDLTILGRDLRNTVLLDNSTSCFGFQVDNGIPIVSWFDDPDDKELLDLLPFLEEMRHVEDVRPILAQKFEFQKFIEGCSDW